MESAPASEAPYLEGVAFEPVWARLKDPAQVPHSFRYTDADLGALADAAHELSRAHGARITKQDILRFGLNVVLRDHELRGDGSLLSELARRKSV